MADTASIEKPKPGEATKAQSSRGSDMAGAFGFAFPGFSCPPTANYATYRKMRTNPTLALARMVATAPIRAAEWSWEVEDDASDDRMEFVQGVLDPLYPAMLTNALYALDYGWQSFEKVWEVKDNRLTIKKLKPLLPDISEIVVDKETGEFAGIKQGKVTLDPSKALLFTYDGEAGELYGRSRHENVRMKAWQPWEDTMSRTGQYITKVSGAIPMVRYPEGKSRDAIGSEVDNYIIATHILATLGKLNGVAMPTNMSAWAEDLARQGVDIEKLWAWQISFIESTGQHGGDLRSLLSHFEALMMRGWLVPERAAIEGQHGTKAESEVHQDIVIAGAELLLDEFIDTIQKQVVDQVLVLNFGEDARGTVKLKPSPLVDEKAMLVRDMVKQVLTQPANVPLLLHTLDMDAMLDNAGLPKREETLDNAAILAAWKAGQPAGPFPFPQQGQPPAPGEPVAEATPNDPAVPAEPMEGDALPAGVAAKNIVEGEKLNGAQITAAKEVLADVASGIMAPEVAVELLIAVGIDAERARRMVDAAVAWATAHPPVKEEPVNDPPPLAASIQQHYRDLQMLFEATAKEVEAA